ncbi:MAG: hypothetical protein ABJC89_24615 [Acidobacteriota bacterium]
MSGFVLTPMPMTMLPTDVDLSYDVVGGQNYTWGAHGMIFRLSETAAGR